jgi:hypothetical protein
MFVCLVEVSKSQIKVWLASSLVECPLPTADGFNPQPGHVCLRVLYQRMDRTLFKFLNSGDPYVIDRIRMLCYMGKGNPVSFRNISYI